MSSRRCASRSPSNGRSRTATTPVERRSSVATGPARRHLHPAPGAHVARIPRERARRSRHSVPRRDQLARVRQPRGARPARASCARSTTRPTHSRSSSALRSSLFGCGDDDLFTYHVEHGGAWDITRPLPDSMPVDHPVAEAITYLAELHEQRTWLAPSALLERSRPGTARARARRFGGPLPRRRAPDPFRRRSGALVQRGDVRDRCASTSRGRSARAPKGRGSSRRCSPKPTTTRCAS